jgi:WD40-like Beta Propeller Repeat
MTRSETRLWRRVIRPILVTVFAPLVLLLSPQPAAAGFPGANGKLVIQLEGLSTLETLKLDGTATLRLGGDGKTPSWSPDGGRIAYEALGHLRVIDANGTHKRKLPVDGYAPAWSPDGTKIVFYGNGTGIHVVNPDGSGLTQLTSAADVDPDWSPDGTTIAFSRYDLLTHTASFWLMDADGGNQRMISDAPAVGTGAADWAPDGSQLIFAAYDASTAALQIWAIDPDGQNQLRLTSTGSNSNPSFSPDGRRIVFTSSRGQGLWTMNVDGSNQVRRNQASASSPDWQPLHVSLHVSRRVVLYKRSVKITAHLYDDPAANGVVTIHYTPYGAATQVLASGVVDADGNFSATVQMKKKTSFSASWSGDAGHPAGGVTQPVTVRVRPRLQGGLERYDGTSGGYRLYDFTSACPTHHRGCPIYAATIAPPHAGLQMHFTLQLRIGSHWQTALTFKREIPATGKLTETFIYRDSNVVGIPSRVRASFGGDADHLPAKTHWSYFKVI